jgi:hypothetical protein
MTHVLLIQLLKVESTIGGSSAAQELNCNQLQISFANSPPRIERQFLDQILRQLSQPVHIRNCGLPQCSNDMTAIGVLHKLYRAGLRVLDDLSVIGFDDIHIAQVPILPLTTIQMSCFELARAAVTALRAHVEEGGEPKRVYKINTHLVVRESTRFSQGHHAPRRQARERRKYSGCSGAKNCIG